jgi:serine/threonine protein kinase
VAVKFLNPTQSIDEVQQQRFDREVQILSELSHPNIVIVHGKIPHTHPCFVMEYMKGMSLDIYLEDHPRLSLAEVRHIGLMLGAALEHIHNKGIVHRDLKPGNIFYTDEKIIKLMDFGMVKVLEDSSLTMTGDVIGTPAYMSPEQRMGIPDLSPATDIYSFGVILYEALAGKRPYPDDKTVLDQIRLKPPPVKDDVPEVPDLLNDVISRCLLSRPEDRPENVQPILEALKAI